MIMSNCWHRLVEYTKCFTEARPTCGGGGSGSSSGGSSSGWPCTQPPTLVQGGCGVCVYIYV